MHKRLSDWFTIPRIAALSVLLFAMLLVVLTKLSAPPEFDFLAGPKDSTFYKDALRFKDILMRDGVRLNVIETKGSLDNLRLLLEAQGGFVGDALPNPGAREFLAGLVQLYRFKKTEAVIQQCLRFAGPIRFRRRSHHGADQPHPIVFG